MFQQYFPQALFLKGQNRVYLDSAATTLKLKCVLETVQKFYEQEVANVHRGDHYLSDSLTLRYEHTREKVRDWIGAESAEEIIFTKSTTESLNLLSFALEEEFQKGDGILLTEMEHHSNLLPWQALAQRKQLDLRFLPVDEGGNLLLEEWERYVTERTRLFAFTCYSNALGLRNPVRKLVRMAQERGILTVLDSAQAMTSEPVRVQELGCDFLAFSGHKLFAGTGAGVLYARKDLLGRMKPYQLGGGMVEEVRFAGYDPARPPQCFEAGTPPIEAVLSLGAVLDFLKGRDFFSAVQKTKATLLSQATEELKKIPGIKIIGEGNNKAPVLSFVLSGVHCRDLGQLISQAGVAVRSGHHCCIPLMKKLKLTSGTVRASFSIYNDEEDLGHLLSAIRKARGILLS